MSLFPAYIPEKAKETEGSPDNKNELWLENTSFQVPPAPAITEDTEDIDTLTNYASTSSKSLIQNTSPVEVASEIPTKKSKHKHKKDHHINKSKKRKIHNKPPVKEQIILTGNEEYYIDKKCERGYLSISTLHRPSCPKYHIHLRSIGNIGKIKHRTITRYYVKNKKDKIEYGERNNTERLTEDEFTDRNKHFNKQLGENPSDIQIWIDFVQHQDLTYMKSTKLQITERKLNILDKALKENNSNEELYKLYVDIINNTYPSYEVSKILDDLLVKDPTNYILWSSQILATQGSMARCVVPDVLKLYETCMKKMYNKARYDEVMLKLFISCCFFLRQSGLYEQFFALIKLSLDLNVSSNKFTKIQPIEQDQHQLIEYEEIVLKSGLPMNELWLRIEKLRQNFYFLPCPENTTCSDPQRIVYNEDIVQFVYPLTDKTYRFKLVINIIRLLKIPLPLTSYRQLNLKSTRLDDQNEYCSDFSEFDGIEEILSIFLYRNFAQKSTQNTTNVELFDRILIDLIKDFSIGPSFIPIHIGHEIYLQVLLEVILLSSECFEDGNSNSNSTLNASLVSNKRNVLINIWLKFERILIVLDKHMERLTDEKKRRVRNKIKNFLKREENRNILQFYTEYALIEYELGSLDKMENIFVAAISQTKVNDDCARSEYYSAYITYAEILMYEENYEKSLNILISMALDGCINEISIEEMPSTEPKKLLALKRITDRLQNLIMIEKNVIIMEIEQYFLSDYLIQLIKAKIYLILLIKRSKIEAIKQLTILLRTFNERNKRHSFIRENLYELIGKISQFPIDEMDNITMINSSNNEILNLLLNGLNEFPENLILLKLFTTLDGFTWHKIRTILTSKFKSPINIIFLIVSARLRHKKYTDSKMVIVDDSFQQQYLSSNCDVNEITYKMRVVNLLKTVLNDKYSDIRKNSLLWRIYLRSLLDVNENFNKSKNTLYAALDECPWNKALYLDGTVYVPQELPHLQDLIIEKQLRINALPEELEILRQDIN